MAKDGRLSAKDDAAKSESYEALLGRSGQPALELVAESKPGQEKEHFAMHSFGAQFCEVRVDPDLGEVRVTRFLGVFGAGRILNEKTAQSQLKGGIVMGVGMALHEYTVFDENVGRAVNPNLAEYHVPVNADIPDIEVIFVEEEDAHINPIGAKGWGNSASPEPPPRWRTRFTMRPADACATFRSHRISCWCDRVVVAPISLLKK